MLNNGFTIQDILGPEVLKNGMTSKQLTYFLNACVSVSAKNINDMTFAYGRIHADQETRTKMDSQLTKIENVLVTSLIKGEF